MAIVREILEDKGYQVETIGPDRLVYDAVALMAEKGIGALMVVDGEKVVGLISERDYARKVILKGRASKETHVRDIMETRVIYVHPDQTVEECMAIVTDRRVRHLPVIENDKLIGLVSIGDLVKSIIDEQKFIIDQLVKYINS